MRAGKRNEVSRKQSLFGSFSLQRKRTPPFFGSLAALLVILGIPALAYDVPSLLAGEAADAVSGATLELPAQPSGRFVLYLNASRHPGTASQWRNFLSGEPEGVIMDDIHCLVLDADGGGAQLARRFQARLAEHQMTVRVENAALLASRAEAGLFDLVLLSEEAAEACGLSVELPDVLLIEVQNR